MNENNKHICPFDDFESGVDDLILGGMFETVMGLMVFSGVQTGHVVVDNDGNEIRINVDRQDPGCVPVDRIKAIAEMAKELSGKFDSVSDDELIRMMFEADGWSVTESTFRTPLWVRDFDEFDRGEISKMDGMSWLEASTSL